MLRRILTLPTLLILWLGLLPRCAALDSLSGGLSSPEFKLERVEFTGISPESLRLKLHTRVINHYPIQIPAGSVDARLRLENSEFSRIKTSFAQGIPANASAAAAFDVEIPFAGLAAAYSQVGQSETMNLGLSGALNVTLPAGDRRPQALSILPDSLSIPIQIQQQIPALKPEVELRNFQLTAPELGLNPTLGVSFDLSILNRAGAALQVNSLNYDLSLENTPFLNGAAEDIRNEGRESIATVRTTLPLVSLGAAIISAARRGSARFHIAGEGALNTPNFPLPELLRMQFEKSGTSSWR
ncbi:MAG: hypothetical protein K1X75_13070 [Leptospirales bacterium]|nr:hypothetical protein [Leptospirales bacterium]